MDSLGHNPVYDQWLVFCAIWADELRENDRT